MMSHLVSQFHRVLRPLRCETEHLTASGDYYQLWTDGVPTINTGPTGLENFGKLIMERKFAFQV